MRPSTMILRCYSARDKDGQWTAVCIDLSLAAQADSSEESVKKLEEQIASYVYEALGGPDQEYASTLLKRKAPLSQRIKFQYIRTLFALSKCIRFLRPSNFKVESTLLPLIPKTA